MSPRKAAPKARRGYGEGSVKQKKNGLWEGSFAAGKDPVTGKPRRLYVTSRDEKVCRDKLKAAMGDWVQQKAPVVGSTMTVNEWLDHWLDNVTQVRPNTKDSYRSSIKYIRPAIGAIRLVDLNGADILAMNARIMRPEPDGLGLSSTTARLAHAIVRTALADCVALYSGKVVDRNVAMDVKMPKKVDADVSILEADEAVKVIEHTWDWRNGSRWAFALLTGARQGESLGLTWDRVDFNDNTITIDRQLARIKFKHGCEGKGTEVTCGFERGAFCPQKRVDAPKGWRGKQLYGGLYHVPTKTETGDRVIPLREPLRSMLLRHQADQRARREPNPFNLVWTADPKKIIGGDKRSITRATADGTPDGMPIDPALDSAAWVKMLAAAEVSKVRLHDARHTAITLLYELGVPELVIQDIAGHADPRITRKYRLKRRMSAQAFESLDRLGVQLTPVSRRDVDDVVEAEVIEDATVHQIGAGSLDQAA